MRYALLADVHGNLEALSAVIDAALFAGAQRFVCAGDLVGYHADPDACVERLRAVAAVCVAGNHDRVAAGIAEPRGFGAAARQAVLWTRGHLTPASRAYLAGLPLHRVVDGRFLLVHAALHPAPNADLHLSSHARVARSIEALRDGPWGVSLALFGHTHRAVVHEASGGAFRSRGGEMTELSLSVPGARYLVNPGSVGQPRDGDPRAAFALLDVADDGEQGRDAAFTLRFRRVAFDVGACHAKAAHAGLRVPASALTRLRAALRRLS